MSSIEYINSTSISSSTTTISFSNIPQNYVDLIITGTIKPTTANVGLRIRFNTDINTNYSSTYFYGNGTSALSGRETAATSIYGNLTIGAYATPLNINIFNYSNTNMFKTAIADDVAPDYTAGQTIGLWRSTAAINNITIALGSTFPSQNIINASVILWGIK